MHFLRISAYVPKSKFKELEQSIRLLNMEGIPKCIEFKLLQQFEEHEHVQLFSLWETDEDLFFFMNNKAYHFLKGTFKALGLIEDISYGIYENQNVENDEISI